MCEKCKGAPAIALAAAAVDAVGPMKFWRDLTPTELEFGDIERVAKDVNDSEVAIASAAKAPLKDLVREVVTSALAAIKTKDIAAVSAITAPDNKAVASALKAATAAAIETGKKQVFDEYRKQTSSKLALPPRLQPKLVSRFVQTKSVAQAEALTNEAIAAAQKMALTQLGRGAYDAEILETFVASKVGDLMAAMARDDAREANGMGRRIAAEDTADEIEAVVYTAIMDSGVCGECEARDGDEYGPEDLGQAPNPDCEGALYAGCRCAEIIIYRKG